MVSVQALRAIAALSILIVHYSFLRNILTGRAAERIPLYQLSAGVDLFFVISGFIMVYASERLFGFADSWREFLARRISRIVPIYWLATFAECLLNPPELSWLLSSLLFIPTSARNFPVLGVGWTLNFEMFFYFVFSSFLFLPRNAAVVKIGSLLALLAVLGAPFAPFSVWFSPIILEFAMGMGVALAYREGLRFPWWIRVALVAGGCWFIWRYESYGPLPLDRWAFWGIPAAMILGGTVLGSDLRFGRLVKPIVALGDSSYALYLFHSIFASLIIRFSSRLSGIPLWQILLAGMTLSIIAALAIHYWVEVPLTRTMRRLLRAEFGDNHKAGTAVSPIGSAG